MPQILGKEVGATGFGLMGFTWRLYKLADEPAFAAMKAAIANNATLWNGGEFYGRPTDPYANLELLNRYFTRYPEDADKVVLSIKGGVDIPSLKPNGTEESIRRSVENILRILDGKKKLDIFECARVDKNVPIEKTIRVIAEYVQSGQIGGIGLSEASATTIHRAHSAHPIAAVEIEYSLWSTDIRFNNVASTCAELGIPVVCYSPLGRGFLTGQIKRLEDIPEGDMRRWFDRFQPEHFHKNLELVQKVESIAQRLGITPAQLALEWIRKQSGQNGMPVLIPIPGATTVERVNENCKVVGVDEGVMSELEEVLKGFSVSGGRYNEHLEGDLFV